MAFQSQRRRARRFTLVAGLALLGGCTAPPQQEPSVSIASPADGAVVTGSRTVTILGTAGGVGEVEVDHDGALATVPVAAGTFGFDVELADDANELTVTASNAAGSASASVTLVYPFVRFEDFEEAAVVVGGSRTGPTSSAPTLSTASAFGQGRFGSLYLVDSFNHRMLYFAFAPTADDAVADGVIGQPDGTSNDPGTAANAFTFPHGLAIDGDRLLLADSGNGRVLVWNDRPTANAPAHVVIGSASFVSVETGCSSRRFGATGPTRIHVGGGKLVVPDFDNRRVLIWNSVPTSSNAAADLVLGQPDMDTCDAHPIGPATFHEAGPTGVWTDGERLVVADRNNNRVLVWGTFPTADNQPADVVIGQPDFQSSGFGAGATGLNFPYAVASNGNQLFVADHENHRVLVYDAFPSEHGAAADRILGQADFDGSDVNAGGEKSGRSLFGPTAVDIDGARLLVSDSGNSRFMIFGSP